MQCLIWPWLEGKREKANQRMAEMRLRGDDLTQRAAATRSRGDDLTQRATMMTSRGGRGDLEGGDDELQAATTIRPGSISLFLSLSLSLRVC